MLKEILKFLKEYEVVENNCQRLNKGYKPKRHMEKLWSVIFERW